MPDVLRSLNERGTTEFRDYLRRLRETATLTPPYGLLRDNNFSEAVVPPTDLDRRETGFVSRHELGMYLTEKLEPIGKQEVLANRGLWNWLALYYFDQLCPADAQGRRKPREIYSYILSDNFRHFPRHAVRTTYQFVSEYGDAVRFMFSKEPSKRGEIIEQLAARIELASSPTVIRAASLLYQDSHTGGFKTGAAGRKGGAVNRFMSVLRQFQLTYDLHTLTPQQLVEMLPREFDRFRPTPTS